MVTLLWAVGLERITPKYIYFNVRMLERTDAITIEVLEPVTFVPACHTVYVTYNLQQCRLETEPGVLWGASVLRKFGHRATVCLSGSSGPFRKKRLCL